MKLAESLVSHCEDGPAKSSLFATIPMNSDCLNLVVCILTALEMRVSLILHRNADKHDITLVSSMSKAVEHMQMSE